MIVNDSWEEARNQVREAADIVQVISECVQLKRAGSRFSGLCPFHGEKTPSFSVNPQGQFFKCFGCGESGDVFAFLMKYHHMSFPEALKELARRYQVDLPESKASAADQERQRRRDLLHQINHEAARIFHACLTSSEKAEPARQYLLRRGVPQEFVVQYQLGYVPPPAVGGWDFLFSRLMAMKFPAEAVEQAGLAARTEKGRWYDRFRDRILFPIRDLSGREVAFGGRILGEGTPKYMNSPESPIFEKSRILFGLHQHREEIRKHRLAIVVEGNFDLLLLAVHGISNVVAPLGTALTREHLKLLHGLCDEAVLLFDGDAAGLKAARRSIPLFLGEQMEARIALLPKGHDPDSLVREKGADEVRRLLEQAEPLPEFFFSALVQEHGLTLSGKNRIMAELVELVRTAPDRARKELMSAHFGEKLGVPPALFLDRTAQVHEIQPQALAQEAEPARVERKPASSDPPAALSAKHRQLLDFLVFYPEFFDKLLKGGLEEHVGRCAPLVQAIVEAMKQLAAKGPFMPEQLLEVLPSGEERRQVAELLQRGMAIAPPDDSEWGSSRCAEILSWLEFEKERHLMLLRIRQTELEKKDSLHAAENSHGARG